MRDYTHWIDAKVHRSSDNQRMERQSPGTGQAIASVTLGTAADVDAAVASARSAFDGGDWANLPGSERAKVLNRLADLIEENLESLSQLEAEEAAKPIGSAREEVGYGVDLTRYAAGLAATQAGELMNDAGPDNLGLVIRQPRGVAGLIVPWNYPVVCLMQKLAFALAAGCAAVIKPSEFTPGTTLRIAELATEAGVPDGQVNVVLGTGEEVGEALTANPGVDMVSFTGSTRVGKQIGAKCGELLKHYSLELGGKGANVIFADADMEAAVEGAYQGFTINAGEECCAGGRILVEASIAEAFTAKLVARCEQAVAGLSDDEDADFGPLTNTQQMDKVLAYIDAGKSGGATLATGGARNTDGKLAEGLFVHPTVFTGVTPEMKIFREEIFGPVGCITTFETFDEAMEMANDTDYGLANGVWTSNLDRAMAATRRLQSGMVYVNTYLETTPQLPFGGMGLSGSGKENGREGLQEFQETRAAFVRLSTSL